MESSRKVPWRKKEKKKWKMEKPTLRGDSSVIMSSRVGKDGNEGGGGGEAKRLYLNKTQQVEQKEKGHERSKWVRVDRERRQGTGHGARGTGHRAQGTGQTGEHR